MDTGTRDESPRVGTVGTGAGVRETVAVAGGTPVDLGSDAAAADVDLYVTADEDALSSLVRGGPPSAPVLPLGYERGVQAVPTARAGVAVTDAVEALRAGDLRTVSRPLVCVTPPSGERRHALFDALLVTSEPARISEYAVDTADDRVAQVRADGIVVATPAGSQGYARAAGGPVLEPGCGSLSVVPVAPFVTAAAHWVVGDDDLSLTVTRDEGDVSLLVDGEDVGVVAPHDPTTLAADGTVSVVVGPHSMPFYRES